MGAAGSMAPPRRTVGSGLSHWGHSTARQPAAGRRNNRMSYSSVVADMHNANIEELHVHVCGHLPKMTF